MAKISGSEWLQLYAVTVSRFFIGTGSGPGAYGPAFGVPTALTDLNYCLGAWNPQDYIVTQGFQRSGDVVRQVEAFDKGYLIPRSSLEGVSGLVRNTASELVAATDEMFNSTQSCGGWRILPEFVPTLPRPNSICFPIPSRFRRELLIPPSQRN